MSRISFLPAFKSLDAADASSSQIGAETNLQPFSEIGLIVESTGAPVGEVIVEVANGTSSWSKLDFDTPLSVSGVVVLDAVIASIPFEKMRVRYVRTSGSGTITCTISGKGR